MKLKNFLTELGEESSSITKYSPKEAFSKFQLSLQSSLDQLKAAVKKNIVGREVKFYASKGFGQPILPYTSNITDVDVILYQDKYMILIRGTEGKGRKQNEYYLDPNEGTYMKIRRGASASNSGGENLPEPKHSPVIRPEKKPVPVPSQSPVGRQTFNKEI